MSYHDYLPARLGPDGEPVFPLAFHDRPRGIEARSGETGTGSIRQDESPARKGVAVLFRRFFTRSSRSEAEARVGA